ncbi:Apre_1838 family putative sactipeptide bacteriocin [Enterococcus faecalis]
MNFINPLGKSENSRSPRACMCYDADGFAGARSEDGCFHCGCGCSPTGDYKSGNSNNALSTIHKS